MAGSAGRFVRWNRSRFRVQGSKSDKHNVTRPVELSEGFHTVAALRRIIAVSISPFPGSQRRIGLRAARLRPGGTRSSEAAHFSLAQDFPGFLDAMLASLDETVQSLRCVGLGGLDHQRARDHRGK